MVITYTKYLINMKLYLIVEELHPKTEQTYLVWAENEHEARDMIICPLSSIKSCVELKKPEKSKICLMF